MKQYQIVPLKRKAHAGAITYGAFDLQEMQDTLNAYAAEGWRLISCSPLSYVDGITDHFIAVLEKDV